MDIKENWIMSNNEINERINIATSKLGSKIEKISLVSNEVNHKTISPVTAIVMLKQPYSFTNKNSYSVHYFYTYGENNMMVADDHFIEEGNYVYAGKHLIVDIYGFDKEYKKFKMLLAQASQLAIDKFNYQKEQDILDRALEYAKIKPASVPALQQNIRKFKKFSGFTKKRFKF